MNPQLKIGFIIDPIETLKPGKDSSLLMMNACQNMGFNVFWSANQSLFINDNELFANWISYENKEIKKFAFNCLDFVFLREEPPIDQDFFELTYLYEQAKDTLFINPPKVLRDISEKLFCLDFPEFTPKQMVSKNITEIENFLEEQKEIIIKPIGSFGSDGVIRIHQKDSNIAEQLKAITLNQTKLHVCQEFLNNVSKGDRRVFLIHGEIAGAFDSVPAVNDFRGNGGFGATFAKAELSTQEIQICRALKQNFIDRNIYFAGVDFVDEKITEINVTCVGGVWNMNHVYEIQYEYEVIEKLLKPFLSKADLSRLSK